MSAAENTALARWAREESVERENRAVVDAVSAPAVDGPASAAPEHRSPEGAQPFATRLCAALFHH